MLLFSEGFPPSVLVPFTCTRFLTVAHLTPEVTNPSVFQLSETKIFTASNVSSVPLPAENVTITAGQRQVCGKVQCLFPDGPGDRAVRKSSSGPSQAPMVLLVMGTKHARFLFS